MGTPTTGTSYTSDLPKHGLYDLKLTMTGYDVYGNLDGYTIANGRTDAFSYLGAYSHDGLKLYLLGGQTLFPWLVEPLRPRGCVSSPSIMRQQLAKIDLLIIN